MSDNPDDLPVTDKDRTACSFFPGYFGVDKQLFHFLGSLHTQWVEPIARLKISDQKRKNKLFHIKKGPFLSSVVQVGDLVWRRDGKEDFLAGFRNR